MEILNLHSESEQMYLVAMARLTEAIEECPIPVSKIAEILSVTPISANQMIHHLEEIGLVSYTPYKGVEFTQAGWEVARSIMRKRRLWEVFFVEKLQYEPSEVGPMACRLEHAISDQTAERLAEFLGWPSKSPTGKDIPQFGMEGVLKQGAPLDSFGPASGGVISDLLCGEEARRFLENSGLRIGTRVEIVAQDHAGPLLVETEQGKILTLTDKVAKQILVTE